MGLEKAKSLLTVKDGYSFLDIIARQALMVDVPLLLMNSFSTEADSLKALEKYPELQRQVPLSFLQHKVPKIAAEDFSYVLWKENPELEWCPPGHGDIYTALVTRGTLKALLAAGYKYAFVSNADNLGATLDQLLLGYFADSDFPFMMEVADRTKMDKKGGHLARRKADGRFILRELAQCPEESLDEFQDIEKYSYFNTNNIWINLEALEKVLVEQDYRLQLPMIRNQKNVDPRDETSIPVYQLETAMGSAISVFAEAQAVRVPRDRFAPVKKTDDLLVVRSDAYLLNSRYEVIPNPQRKMKPPIVELDPAYYKFVTDLDERFPDGAPSLLACQRLKITGDFLFGSRVVCRGNVKLHHDSGGQMIIESGTVLEGEPDNR
jgi:UTP--glucose-1-phosphate uridylyltransferase